MKVTIKTTAGGVLASTQSAALGIEHAAASAIRQAFSCASCLVPAGCATARARCVQKTGCSSTSFTLRTG